MIAVTRFAITSLLVIAPALGGCVSNKQAWDHYDNCSSSGSFIAMAECGKSKRAAYCATASNCGASGTSLVLYADSLASSVRSRELTDAEAMRRYLEFRSNLIRERNSGQPTEIIVRR